MSGAYFRYFFGDGAYLRYYPIAKTILALASAQATVHLIRHSEKPSSGDGLSTPGERARSVHLDESEQRPYDTDTSCDRDSVVGAYSGPGNIQRT